MLNPTDYMVNQIQLICADIESRKGRLNPPVINIDDFKKNRDSWVKRIKDGYHFRENRIVLAFDLRDVDNELKRMGFKERVRSKSPLDDRSKRRKAESKPNDHSTEPSAKRYTSGISNF